MDKIKKTLKKWNSVFCSGMVCKANVKRDAYVVLSAIFIASVFLYSTLYSPEKNREDEATQAEASDEFESESVEENISAPVMTEEKISAEVEEKIKSVDPSGWIEFKNPFWGFTVKYPGDWLAPKAQNRPAGTKWETRYQFRKKDAGENQYLGFDVAVYDVPKIKELANTEEYPILKNPELKTEARCQNIEGHAIEVNDFSAEEIYVPPTDDCFNQALFFSIIKERYIYNIVPVSRGGLGAGADVRVSVNENFPEFYFAASTLELVNIVRPKPAPPKPKITAPKPVSFRVAGGKLVCAKKNDKPRKSRKNKGKHLDMECCLDPDETPNPWCTY